MAKYILGIDHGGTLSKAALFDTEGREIAFASRPVNIIHPQKGWSERDADKMWNDTYEIISETIHKSGIDANSILAVGCTGHGNGLYLVDENGNPVRNAINSSDLRAIDYIEKWRAKGIDEEALPLTAQSLWPAQPNALLSWLKDFEPESMKKARWVLMAKDFIRMKLTGKVHAEITDMSATSLMNVVKGEYDEKVLSLFGLKEIQELLPPLIGSPNIGGFITPEASRLTGLKEGTPVAGGMFDIDACGIASGIVDEGQMSLVAGTWGNNQYIAKTPLIDKELFMTSIYSIPGWYLILEGSPTSVSNLDWFVNTFLAKEKEKMGDEFFGWMENMAAKISPESSNIKFLPFLYGCNENAPLGACFYGMQGRDGQSEMIRSVYEGIVFAHKRHIERLLQFRHKPTVIRCTGGATHSAFWMQMFADIIGIPLEIPEGNQLGALGAAMAASVGANVYSDFEEAVRNMVRIKNRFEPDYNRIDIYSEKYEEYKGLVKALHRF